MDYLRSCGDGDEVQNLINNDAIYVRTRLHPAILIISRAAIFDCLKTARLNTALGSPRREPYGRG